MPTPQVKFSIPEPFQVRGFPGMEFWALYQAPVERERQLLAIQVEMIMLTYQVLISLPNFPLSISEA
jgi:hypothetical protein